MTVSRSDTSTEVSIENNPLGTQREKPSRNYDKSWQFAKITLVNVDLPFTIGVREIASRKNKQYNIHQLFDLVEGYIGCWIVAQKVTPPSLKESLDITAHSHHLLPFSSYAPA